MNKTRKKRLALLLALTLLVNGAVIPASSAQAAKALSITNVSGTVKIMYTGSVFQLKTNASAKQTVTYQSKNTSVAKVSSAGLITAKKAGKAAIIIKNKSTGKKNTLTVRVKKSPYFTVSKKSGKYSGQITIKVKAKKGYQVFYTTGKKFTKKNVISSGKIKKITISKKTTLSVYAVKNGGSVSLKTMKKYCGTSLYSAKYLYRILADAADSSSEPSETAETQPTNTPDATSADAQTAATGTPASSTGPSSQTASPAATADPSATAEPAATVDPAADTTDKSVTEVNQAADFTEEELNPVDDPDQLTDAVTITLSSSGWTASDTANLKIKNSDSVENEQTNTSYSIGTVTINAAGTYLVSGDGEDGNYQIKVKKGVTGVVLVFHNLTLQNAYTAPVLSNKNTNTTIILAKDSVNCVTGPEEYADLVEEDGAYESDTGSAIHGKGYDEDQSSLLITGSGSLTVTSQGGDAIQSKGALRIANGNITVVSGSDGLQGKDEIAIGGGTIDITSAGDGMKTTNETSGIEYGYIDISGGTITIDAQGDGIQAVTTLYVRESPVIAITVSAASGADSDDSMKGMKVSGVTSPAGITDSSAYIYGLLKIAGGTISIDTSDTGSSNSANSENTGDDAIHSNSDIEITDGTITIDAADDAIHADGKILLRDGTITINSCYEGLESAIMYLDGGEVKIISEDDGINIAGGDSGSSDNSDPWQTNPSFRFASDTSVSFDQNNSSSDDYALYINGGRYLVLAQGDGLDANGNIYMNDGEVYVYCTSSGGDAALDYDYKFQMNGGTLLAAGPSDMAAAPDSSSTQYSLVVSLSSNQSAGSVFHIQDSSGQNVLTAAPPAAYSHVVYSSPDLVVGDSYAVYTGGSAAGSITDYYVYDAGVSYAAGTLRGNITLSSYQSVLSSSISFR
ncbi:MAG: carbohydrate-binding domain-containing protein [Clostridiaceae bacterium]|nr:carbohydrate-binding domain-containing protein [Clostridiaceae bacterium]